MMDCWGRKFVKAAVLSKGATTGSANRSGLWSGDTLSRCQAPLTTRCPLDDFVSPTFTLTGTSHSLFDSMGLLSSPSGAYTPLPKSASELIAPPDPRTRLRTLGLTLAAFLLVVLPLLWTHPGVSIARVAVEEEAPTSPDAKGFCSDATSLSVEAPKRSEFPRVILRRNWESGVLIVDWNRCLEELGCSRGGSGAKVVV